jgi:hypothetical protein
VLLSATTVEPLFVAAGTKSGGGGGACCAAAEPLVEASSEGELLLTGPTVTLTFGSLTPWRGFFILPKPVAVVAAGVDTRGSAVARW